GGLPLTEPAQFYRECVPWSIPGAALSAAHAYPQRCRRDGETHSPTPHSPSCARRQGVAQALPSCLAQRHCDAAGEPHNSAEWSGLSDDKNRSIGYLWRAPQELLPHSQPPYGISGITVVSRYSLGRRCIAPREWSQ